jgi:1-aminocyclopropane-1-carboxylate synthase
MEVASKPWSAKAPAAGVINLCVSEDKLSADLLAEKLHAVAAPLEPSELGYNNMKGTQELRARLAAVYGRLLAPTVTFDPAHLCVLSGAGAVLENVAFCIASPGESILIPAPCKLPGVILLWATCARRASYAFPNPAVHCRVCRVS